MIPIVMGLIVKAATVVRAVQAISSALRPSPKPPASESVPQPEKVLCGRFAPTRDKYRYCGNDPIGLADPEGLDGFPPHPVRKPIPIKKKKPNPVKKEKPKFHCVGKFTKMESEEGLYNMDMVVTLIVMLAPELIPDIVASGRGGTLGGNRRGDGFPGGRGGARKPPKNLPLPPGYTHDERLIREGLGLSREEFREKIHEIKQGFDNNPDVAVDPVTGDVIHRGSNESIGNLLDL